MKNLNETNMEELNLNEMTQVKGGSPEGNKGNSGDDRDVLILQ